MLNYTYDLGNNNNNCTSLPKTIVVVNCAINAPLMLISVIGNALVLAAILRTPSLRSPSTIFLCNLAASDLLVGIVVQPVYIVYQLKPESFPATAVIQYVGLVCCGVSLGTMATISVDRYLALHYHMRYPNLMTKKRALCTSGALWSLCLLLTCVYFKSQSIYFLTTVVGIAMCISVTTFSYVSIYRIARQHQLQIHVQQQAVQSLNTAVSLRQQSYNMLALLCCGVSLGTMATISVDRYLALHYHMRYPNLMTKKRTLCTSGALWSLCLLLTCVYFKSQSIYFLTTVVGIAMCISVTTFSYVSIYRIARQHQLQIHVQQQALQSLNTEPHLNIVQSKKSATNTFIYYVCMMLCYSPVFISVLIFAIFPKRPKKALIFADTVLFMNSSINPFLYCWRLHELRTAVLKTLRKLLSRES